MYPAACIPIDMRCLECGSLVRKVDSKYQCQYPECKKTFSQDEIDEPNSFYERVCDYCYEHNCPISDNRLPTLDRPRIFKALQRLRAGESMEEIKKDCHKMIRSFRPIEKWGTIEKHFVRVLEKALGEAHLPVRDFVFSRNGDSWEIIYQGTSLPPIRHRIGFKYIHYFLGHPGEQFKTPLQLEIAVMGSPIESSLGRKLSSLSSTEHGED